MDNYVYIVAGLPELTSGFENTGFDYAAVKASIVELLSEKYYNRTGGQGC